MTNLRVLTKERELIFSGMVFNDNNQLEFTNVDADSLKGFTFVFNEEDGKLEMKVGGKTLAIDLEKEQVKKLREKRQEIHDYVIDLYMGILKGDEGLLFLDIGLKDFPYIITSKSILNAKVRSPKYNNALMYVFSEKILKANNKQIDFNFDNYEDFQQKLGKKVKRKNMNSNYRLDGQDVISLKWSELVS